MIVANSGATMNIPSKRIACSSKRVQKEILCRPRTLASSVKLNLYLPDVNACAIMSEMRRYCSQKSLLAIAQCHF